MEVRVDEAGGALTRRARAAGGVAGRPAAFAQQRLPEGEGGRSRARSGRPVEQVGVRDAPCCERVLEHADRAVLTDDVGEKHGRPAGGLQDRPAGLPAG